MAKKGPSTFIDRLHRIEGQIRGIERQLNAGEETKQVLIQLEAVISSLNSLKLEIVKKEVKDSIMAQIDGVVSLLK